MQEGDSLVSVGVVTDHKQVVLQTKEGYFLRFPAVEVSEKKKGAVGVRGIRLKKNDEVEAVYLFDEGADVKVVYKEKEVSLSRLRIGKRDTQGVKNRG